MNSPAPRHGMEEADNGRKSGRFARLARPDRRRTGTVDVGGGWLLYLAVAWLALLVLLAISADLLPLRDPAELSSQMAMSLGESSSELLGTDILGRSVLSRVIHGGRVSLFVGFVATFLGLVVGTAMGLAAGYFGGRAATAIDIVVDVILAFPILLLLIALATITSPGVTSLTLALSLPAVPLFARIARANTVALGNSNFVLAAEAMGTSRTRILLHEVLPNIMPPVLAYAVVIAAALMVAEGSLSFLGLGIPPPTPSWGGMIASGRDQLRNHPHLVLTPGVVFAVTIFAMNIVGDHLRAGSTRASRVRKQKR